MKLSFTKMQGCANDYIYLDCRASGVPADIAALAQRLSARHFSVGADGIICICAPVTPGADGRMRIFNADGSEAQMCGNGVRCVAEWLYTHGVEKLVLTIDTNSRAGDINSEFDMAVVLPPLRVVPSSLRVVLLPLRVVIPRVTSTYNR